MGKRTGIFSMGKRETSMNTYQLTRDEVNLIAEALNSFESTLIERFHAAQGPAEKKSVDFLLKEIGLIGLYLTHERVAA